MFQFSHGTPQAMPHLGHGDAPMYHEDRLLVKIRDGVRRPMAGHAGAVAMPAMADSPGLSLTDRFDRSGMIRSVVTFDSFDDEPGVAGAAATAGAVGRMMALGAGPDGPSKPNFASGLSMIQTNENAEIRDLQNAFANDPSVEYVSRVPMRYLVARTKPGPKKKKPTSKKKAKKKASKKKGSRATPAAIPPNSLVMWNLERILWRQARAAGLNNANSVKVGVLDTGIDLGHPDLPGASMNHVYNYGNVWTSNRDIEGHGTHVAGTIRALINNAYGVNGICECQLTAYKIFGDQVYWVGNNPNNGFRQYRRPVDPALYHAALLRCLNDGMRVINLSIAGPAQPSRAESMAFADLINNNCVVVAAMGNDNSSRPVFPAAIPNVFAVGATNQGDMRAWFSNMGPHISICAPGTSIWSTMPTYSGDSGYDLNPWTGMMNTIRRENDYAALQGTSMASPHVAAAAAMLIGANPSLTQGDVKQLLMDNADKIPAMMGQDHDFSFGYGRLNLERLV